MYPKKCLFYLVLLIISVLTNCDEYSDWRRFYPRAAAVNEMDNDLPKTNFQQSEFEDVSLDYNGNKPNEMNALNYAVRNAGKNDDNNDNCPSEDSSLTINSTSSNSKSPTEGSIAIPPPVQHPAQEERPSQTNSANSYQTSSGIHDLQKLIQQLYVAQAQVQLEATEIQRAQSVAAAEQQSLEEASNNVRVITAALHAAQQAVADAALRAQTAQLQLAAHDQLLFTARQRVDALSAQMVALQAEQGFVSNKMSVDLPALLTKLKEPLKEGLKPTAVPSIIGNSGDTRSSSAVVSAARNMEYFDNGANADYGINLFDENAENAESDGIADESIVRDAVKEERDATVQKFIETIAKNKNEKFINEFLDSMQNGMISDERNDAISSPNIAPGTI